MSKVIGFVLINCIYILVATGFLGLTIEVVSTAIVLASLTFTMLQFKKFMYWLF